MIPRTRALDAAVDVDRALGSRRCSPRTSTVAIVHGGHVDRPAALQDVTIAPGERVVLPLGRPSARCHGRRRGRDHVRRPDLRRVDDLRRRATPRAAPGIPSALTRRRYRRASWSSASSSPLRSSPSRWRSRGGSSIGASSRRRRRGARSRPQQLDRNDFPRPDAPWLVVLFTSRHCDSCAGPRRQGAAARVRRGRAWSRSSTRAQPELHARYQIDAAPITVLVDREGVTRASFIGAFTAPDLWSALAELRAGRPTNWPGSERLAGVDAAGRR